MTQGHYSASNKSRWQELRERMLLLDQPARPEFRSKCLSTGYVSGWDREWQYRFSDGGYSDVEWFELRGGALFEPDNFNGIVEIQFAGDVRDGTLRLCGYVEHGTVVGKLAAV